MSIIVRDILYYIITNDKINAMFRNTFSWSGRVSKTFVFIIFFNGGYIWNVSISFKVYGNNHVDNVFLLAMFEFEHNYKNLRLHLSCRLNVLWYFRRLNCDYLMIHTSFRGNCLSVFLAFLSSSWNFRNY